MAKLDPRSVLTHTRRGRIDAAPDATVVSAPIRYSEGLRHDAPLDVCRGTIAVPDAPLQ